MSGQVASTTSQSCINPEDVYAESSNGSGSDDVDLMYLLDSKKQTSSKKSTRWLENAEKEELKRSNPFLSSDDADKGWYTLAKSVVFDLFLYCFTYHVVLLQMPLQGKKDEREKRRNLARVQNLTKC